jgi:hypothetical protein
MRRPAVPRSLVAALALASLAWAVAQPTFTIALDQASSGTIGTLDTTHVYLLDVPSGLSGFTVEVIGGDRDADLAVFFGDEELYRDVSSEPDPTYVATSPRAGRYRIEVLNLLFQELPYTIRVSRGATGAPTRPTPPVATGAEPIELGGTRTGTIPASEIYRAYLLEVPAGVAGFTVRVTAGGADADMEVYFGDEELYDDISSDPNPAFSLRSPRAGTYRIVVKNLLSQPLAYELSVVADGAAPVPTRPTPPTAAGLRLGAGVVAPAAPIGVSWTGAPGNARDWVGLYRVDAEDRAFVAWQYTGGALAGDLTFTAPTEPGRYEFRLFENDGYTRLAVSGAFEVTAGVAAPPPSGGRAWVEAFASGGTDGWTGEHASLSNPGTGGPDGRGYLYASTPGEGEVGYFVAPARLLGDWSSFTALRLALQIGPRHDGRLFSAYESGGVGDVFLANGAMTASYTFEAAPTRAWGTFLVPLADGARWRLGGGARSLADVLADVTAFKVRAEYVEGDADAGMASVEALGGAARTVPAGPTIELACTTVAEDGDLGALAIGTSVSVRCPAGCRDETAVWGTDVYTDDSAVCRAAIHAGVIDVERGGAFVLTIQGGEAGYEASTRQGVTTRPWGAWSRSFAVAPAGSGVGTGADAVDALLGAWRLDANGFAGTLTFERQGGALVGTFDLGRPERLEDVAFDGATVRFVRALGANTQRYVGRLEDDGATQRFTGTFDQGGQATTYPWSAERPRPTGVASPPPASTESVAVASDQAATLTTAQGVVVSVPAGAVPVAQGGGVGTMVVSAEPSTLTPSVPGGFAAVGPVVQLGPVGLTFEQPVTLTFPIPDGVDPATVVGLTTIDPADGTWVVVPGVVDPIARTVTVWTDHFSPWSVATRPGGRPTDGGVLQIANGMVRAGSQVYPCAAADASCRAGLPTSHGYGVCMVSWDLDDPNQRVWGVRDGLSRVATALDGQTIDWWLPDGTYVLEPFFHMSQINQSPLYVPRHQMYVQPAITLTLRGGQVVALGDDYPRGYVEGWTHCHGGTGAGSTRGPITSVGTGDVQVTLTWQADVDLDLYVTDPNGDTVYYGNDRVPSGGELDRDNMCVGFEWGRPENVYWPVAGAPSGTYVVKVDYYGSCGDGSPSVAWTVRTIVGGRAQTFTGTIGASEEVEVTTFTIR